MTAHRLQMQLESELPSELAIGGGTAVFVCGWCFCPGASIRELSFEVAGELQPVMAHSMPRLDPLLALDDPRSYRSGFWGMVRISAAAGGEVAVGLRAQLEGSGETRADLGRIAVVSGPRPRAVSWPSDCAGPRVAIAMATYEAPAKLLARQLESIRAQTHRNWICVISDDHSSAAASERLERAIAGDPRFVLSCSPRRLGFYGNFERALGLVPGDADYVALSDQDDAWYPDKLAALLAGIGKAQLVYSDARVVARDGTVIADTWWTRRRNNHTDVTSLLVANSVTGAASLFPRRLLDDALPFPPAQFAHFHDHWLGLVALARGGIAYVDRPLYDYVQHRTASLGHAQANQMPTLRDRLANRRAMRDRVRLWRLHYFLDMCRILQFATVLDMRCAPAMTRRRRRALRRFLAAERSPRLLLALALRGARELTGTPETLGAEWMLLHALAWRRLVAITARERPQRHLRLDSLPPPTLIQPPGREGVHASAGAIAEKIAPLRWRASDSAPARVNLLIPAFDLEHFFGGYIAKLNLGRRLAELGLRVRVITVDPVGALPTDWRQRVQAYSGLKGVFDKVEVAFGREAAAIEVSRADIFVASTWWTAHIAHDALRNVDAERFLYLIQEYEPFTFPMGSYAALAEQSYRLPHFALFSSELLRVYFRRHSLGVYAEGDRAGEESSAAFQNAITPVTPPSAAELAARGSRRLLFYSRPEPHAARNMFELGVLALARAVQDGAFADGWELRGIGTIDRGRTISLGAGATVELLPRADQRAYADVLREHDVGLALMYTPHPSLVPIEMASAGMVTVTNSFENKTPEAMAELSPNLITAAPTVDAIALALRQAQFAAEDADARVRGSAVRWSRDWNAAFGDSLLARVLAGLGLEQPGEVTSGARPTARAARSS